MKIVKKLKAYAIFTLLMGFFFTFTVSSCGSKKGESTEQTEEHPAAEEEHPTADEEHPTDSDEHPKKE
ncbi:hypothetical protein [uncultured Cyclobacterium sp.]|uniref:hypothetical protein n=1 Tax=uncultured Cyclobacterium sp. TaxID=453820 RepID=UPI0030EF70CE|tara:strand:+ start:109811 stop:110014 length:204 start_codon:yes stop_codon:yes gene_type:complete